MKTSMRIRKLPSSVHARLTAIAVGLAVLCALSGWTFELPSLPQSPADILAGHARYLTSEQLTGRGVDTPGIKLARDYIAREFAKYGLRPGGDNGTYLQGFDVPIGVTIKEPTALVLESNKPLHLNQDWTPLGLSNSGTVEAEVVFAGYGITVKDYGYDDYAGLDVKGRIVLVLRYEPPPKDEKSPFQKAPRYSSHAALYAKAANARDHGAIGMILVDLNNTPDEQRELLSTRRTLWRSNASVVAGQIKRRVADKWLEPHGISLAALKERIDREEKPASTTVPGLRASFSVTLEEIRQRAENVVGILPGSDPDLKDENIVVGAHFDHLGFGHYGTRGSATEGQIHHGADDNASGTAVLLRVAEQMARSEARPARTVIFAAFSGEELGLHGSRHYVGHPPFPISSTKTMLNLDMVGRLRNNRLTVFGTPSAKELKTTIMEEASKLGIHITEPDGVGRSDHISFYTKKIPAVHFFTGTHGDYHRPSDTWDKLNLEGMGRVAELVLACAYRLAATKEPMNFVALPLPARLTQDAEREGYGTYLGSIPDFERTTDGVRLAGVRDGSPAALAGLQEGDIIISLAERKINNLEDLVAVLRSKRPGDSVEVIVLRDNKPLTVKAILKGRG